MCQKVLVSSSTPIFRQCAGWGSVGGDELDLRQKSVNSPRMAAVVVIAMRFWYVAREEVEEKRFQRETDAVDQEEARRRGDKKKFLRQA